MRILASAIVIAFILTGCGSAEDPSDEALELRRSIMEAETCSFQTLIYADYEDELYSFQMDCASDSTGTIRFTVTEPVTIAGITGELSGDGGALTFDDRILAFPMLTQLQLTPVSGPWIFLNTLRSGYITGCGREEDDLVIYIDDSFEEEPLHMQLYVNKDLIPYCAEIFWKERRILTLEIQNFKIM